MKQLNYLTLVLLIGFFSSCTSSKKFDFASAYKFRTIKHSANVQQTPTLNETQLIVSSDKHVSNENDLALEMTEAENKLLERTGLMASNEKLTKEELTTRVASLDKKDKRHLRKELIKELKSEMKEMKSLEKSNYANLSEASNVDMTGYTRTGVLVGGLGVIVLILGALFGVGALTAAGAILILVGVVFILIDVI